MKKRAWTCLKRSRSALKQASCLAYVRIVASQRSSSQVSLLFACVVCRFWLRRYSVYTTRSINGRPPTAIAVRKCLDPSDHNLIPFPCCCCLCSPGVGADGAERARGDGAAHTDQSVQLVAAKPRCQGLWLLHARRPGQPPGFLASKLMILCQCFVQVRPLVESGDCGANMHNGRHRLNCHFV
jgi:hypothetical protein